MKTPKAVPQVSSLKSQVSSPDRSRLLSLRVKNVKCIREVRIDEIGDLHEIRGDTGQGKSAILTSIEAALRGLDPSLVRNGESAAEIELHLSNAVINRIVPRLGKETLLVQDSHGLPVKGSLATDLLRSICGASAFRPIEWVRLASGDPKGRTERLRSQRDQLLSALPLELSMDDVIVEVQRLGDEDCYGALAEVPGIEDISFDQHALLVCAALEKAAYNHRAGQNRLVESAEADLRRSPAPPQSPPALDLPALQRAQDDATRAFHTAAGRAENQKAARARAAELRNRIQSEDEEITEKLPVNVTATVSSITKRQEFLRDEHSKRAVRVEQLRKDLQIAETDLLNAWNCLQENTKLQARVETNDARKRELAEIETSLGAADDTQLPILETAMHQAKSDADNRRLQNAHDAAAKTLSAARAQSDLLDRLVRLFRDDLPKALIARAKLPVPGLSVDGEQVLVDGVPLHALGTSQQIRAGVLVAAALNPHSAFVLVDGAESLGRADRIALADAAHELGLQLILTVVDPDASPGPDVTVMRQGVAAS